MFMKYSNIFIFLNASEIFKTAKNLMVRTLINLPTDSVLNPSPLLLNRIQLCFQKQAYKLILKTTIQFFKEISPIDI